MPHRPALVLTVAIKVSLVALAAFGTFAGLDRFVDKGFGWRLAAYPLAVLILPAVWHFFGNGRPFPFVADVLLTLPFLIDVLGNVFNLYDTVTWWDDANHFVNWALLSGGVGVLLLRTRLQPLVIAALIVGFGSFAALLWELGEYFAFIRHSDELATAYQDTLGDMALGTCGAMVAAALTAGWRRRHPTASPALPQGDAASQHVELQAATE